MALAWMGRSRSAMKLTVEPSTVAMPTATCTVSAPVAAAVTVTAPKSLSSWDVELVSPPSIEPIRSGRPARSLMMPMPRSSSIFSPIRPPEVGSLPSLRWIGAPQNRYTWPAWTRPHDDVEAAAPMGTRELSTAGSASSGGNGRYSSPPGAIAPPTTGLPSRSTPRKASKPNTPCTSVGIIPSLNSPVSPLATASKASSHTELVSTKFWLRRASYSSAVTTRSTSRDDASRSNSSKPRSSRAPWITSAVVAATPTTAKDIARMLSLITVPSARRPTG